MKEFDFIHNDNGTITELRFKNNKYIELLTFSKDEIPCLLVDLTKRLPPAVRRYMEKVNKGGM